jgi:divinyl protochlorophyllide a 8-vinyl-reductase
MPSAPAPCARIGPNAILQTVAVLDRTEGRATRDRVMARAGVAVPPTGSGMVPETDCAAVHHAVRCLFPDQADALLRQSGIETGRYILRHRIPAVARILIRALPAPAGARLLVAAITRHAWTFTGSGGFRVAGWHPLVFEVTGNPLAQKAVSGLPQCHWHAAVFETLLSTLCWPSARVTETACTATGAVCCRFTVDPRGGACSSLPLHLGKNTPG